MSKDFSPFSFFNQPITEGRIDVIKCAVSFSGYLILKYVNIQSKYILTQRLMSLNFLAFQSEGNVEKAAAGAKRVRNAPFTTSIKAFVKLEPELTI